MEKDNRGQGVVAPQEKLLDKDDYYKDSSRISFSGLKVFSKCETLYRDMFVTKVYEEPEHDYFVYGKLVDAIVTEAPEFIPQNFMKVTRKIDPEDALKFENQIKELQKEIDEKEAKLKEKPNKTLEKGIASRKKTIEEIQLSLDSIKHLADKQQVTPAVWENAEQTALGIKTHPYYSNLKFNELTSQQIFTCEMQGMPCKGKLDHLKLSPAITKFYAIYKANHMTLQELQQRIEFEVNPHDKWAIITDIKTCYDVAKLEPFNTHYRGQLGFYQDLVSTVLKIPIENITVRILVADKLTNKFKKAELFEYTQEALDELKSDVRMWMKLWRNAMENNDFVSDKQKRGLQQECFTCSDCRFCPFSLKPGEPVMISKARFGGNEGSPLLKTELSTVDAVLEY